MALPRHRVTLAGQTLTYRVWMLLEDARRAAGLPTGAARVLQGSWADGSLSAGTHSGGGAVDLSVAGLSLDQRNGLVHHLRRRNACAWERSTRYGWTSGDHIHAIIRDEPGLSRSAAAQVAAYDDGRNGLANRGRDPHPQPRQYPIEEVMLMDWPVGKSKMVKPKTAVRIPANRYVTLASITLPKGGRFLNELQVRAPIRMTKPGEACLSRVGWGDGSARDDTGHNPIAPMSKVERWRSPVCHQIAGGGRLEFRVWMPGKDGETFLVKFVAKSLRLS